MNPDIKKRWIAKLESGELAQGTKALCQPGDVLGTGKDAYCCLGVLCEIAVEDGIIERREERIEDGKVIDVRYGSNDEFLYGGDQSALLPRSVMEWAGIDTPNPDFYAPLAGPLCACCQKTDDMHAAVKLNDDDKFTFADIANAIRNTENL
jgi:hypothetical protein